MSNLWELEKEKERTSFQCVGVSLSLHPSAFLDLSQAWSLRSFSAGQWRTSLPGTTSLQRWGSDGGSGGGVAHQCLPLGPRQGPPEGRFPEPQGEGQGGERREQAGGSGRPGGGKLNREIDV